MAWYPTAIRREVTRHRTRIQGPRRLIYHTAVSAGSSLFNYFNQSGNPTSHFYLRADGTFEQYVDTIYVAPANLEANPDSISVESQDMGGPFPSWTGENVPAWTTAQLRSLAMLTAWVNEAHQITLELLPDSCAGRIGCAYHRQGADPWRKSGCQTWSNAYGKICPGNHRVAQIPGVIAEAKKLVGGLTDMALDAAAQDWLKKIFAPYIWTVPMNLTSSSARRAWLATHPNADGSISADTGQVINVAPWSFLQWSWVQGGILYDKRMGAPPVNLLDAIWWRASGLKDEGGKDIPIFKVLSDSWSKIQAIIQADAGIELKLDDLVGRPASTADVDETALAIALVAAGLGGLSDADVHRIVLGVANEMDRREWGRRDPPPAPEPVEPPEPMP